MKKNLRKILLVLGLAIAAILAIVVMKSRRPPQTVFIRKTPNVSIKSKPPKSLILDLDNLETIKKLENDFNGVKAIDSKKGRLKTSKMNGEILDQFTEVYRNKKMRANLKPGLSQIPQKTDSARDLKKKVELNLSVDF